MTLELVTEDRAYARATLTASELMARSGISYRQLDFWVRTGYLKTDKRCPGTGVHRHFTEAEARIAGFAIELITAGFATVAAITHARRLVESGPFQLAGGLIVIGDRP